MDELFIQRIETSRADDTSYPFSIPAIKQLADMRFDSPVTFIVGENGSGKSTIVEAIAVAAGFNAEGGTKNYSFSTYDTTSGLADKITLIRGAKREKYGYFLRAESFYTTANYADTGTSGPPILFDGKRIHEQSHGEAFLSIVKEFQRGLYIFDEPESALSPQRQLSLMAAMHQLVAQGAQFIIATHSPIITAYPGASIYQLSGEGIERTSYENIEGVALTKDFLINPQEYLRHLFKN